MNIGCLAAEKHHLAQNGSQKQFKFKIFSGVGGKGVGSGGGEGGGVGG